MVVVIDRVHVAPVILMWYDKYDITKYYATSCSYYQFLQNRTWIDLSPSPQRSLRMGGWTAPYLLVDPSTIRR